MDAISVISGLRRFVSGSPLPPQDKIPKVAMTLCHFLNHSDVAVSRDAAQTLVQVINRFSAAIHASEYAESIHQTLAHFEKLVRIQDSTLADHILKSMNSLLNETEANTSSVCDASQNRPIAENESNSQNPDQQSSFLYSIVIGIGHPYDSAPLGNLNDLELALALQHAVIDIPAVRTASVTIGATENLSSSKNIDISDSSTKIDHSNTENKLPLNTSVEPPSDSSLKNNEGTIHSAGTIRLGFATLTVLLPSEGEARDAILKDIQTCLNGLCILHMDLIHISPNISTTSSSFPTSELRYLDQGKISQADNSEFSSSKLHPAFRPFSFMNPPSTLLGRSNEHYLQKHILVEESNFALLLKQEKERKQRQKLEESNKQTVIDRIMGGVGKLLFW